MIRFAYLASAAIAAALLCATPTRAAVMTVSMNGDYDDDPPGSEGYWTLALTYDLGRMESFDPSAAFWDASSGTPSPILSGSLDQDNGLLGPFHWDVTDATSFRIDLLASSYMFEASGPGGFFTLGASFLGPPTSLTAPAGLDQDFHGGSHGWSGASAIGGTPFIDQMDVVRAPTPEPATWAVMLLGFFGVGAALRRLKCRRAYPPSRSPMEILS